MNPVSPRTFSWGIKEEGFSTMGQWKLCRTKNRDWNRQALSWPVLPDGSWNEALRWPLEGCLLYRAPWSETQVEAASTEKRVPNRLRVLKNGVLDQRRVQEVIVPQLRPRSRPASRAAADAAEYPLDTTLWLQRKRGLSRKNGGTPSPKAPLDPRRVQLRMVSWC